MVPSAETAEAGDKHARTEAQPSGSPTKGAKKPKTDAAETGKDQAAENGAATDLKSAVGNNLKPSSPKKGGAAASKEPEAVPEINTKPSSPTKAAASSPKKGASSPKKGAIAEKVEAAVPSANKA